MSWQKVQTKGSRDTYTRPGFNGVLIVQGDRGVIREPGKGAKKVRVSISGNTANITEEIGDWLNAGHKAQDWLNGKEE